jgi:signal transduction histidine kinase
MWTTAAAPAAPDRSQARDRLIAAVVAAIQVAGSYAIVPWRPGDHHYVGIYAAVIGYLLLAAGGAVLIWRRRYPVAVLAVTLVIALTASALGARISYLALIIALFTAVLTSHRKAAIASLGIGYLASVLPGWIRANGERPPLGFALGLLAWLLVLYCAAELLRARNQRAVEQARAREEELERRAMAERLAIARDLHDIVAHNISVINVQANTALHLMDRQPERARQALTAIHEVSKQALTELRSVLGVLRTDQAEPPRTPGPGIDQLADLANRAQSAGLPVRLSERGEHRPLPAEVSVAAYRIVQEALTNAARHAPGGTATVQINYADHTLTVEVDNETPVPAAVAAGRTPLAGQPDADPGTGSGITGMTERAQALGGSLQAGPRPGGGFRVQATLPIEDGSR